MVEFLAPIIGLHVKVEFNSLLDICIDPNALCDTQDKGQLWAQICLLGIHAVFQFRSEMLDVWVSIVWWALAICLGFADCLGQKRVAFHTYFERHTNLTHRHSWSSVTFCVVRLNGSNEG